MPFCGIRGTSSLSSYKVQDVSLVIQNIQSICCHTSQRKIGGQSVTKALKLHTPVQYILRIAGLTSVVSLRLHCINFGWHSAALINWQTWLPWMEMAKAELLVKRGSILRSWRWRGSWQKSRQSIKKLPETSRPLHERNFLKSMTLTDSSLLCHALQFSFKSIAYYIRRATLINVRMINHKTDSNNYTNQSVKLAHWIGRLLEYHGWRSKEAWCH